MSDNEKYDSWIKYVNKNKSNNITTKKSTTNGVTLDLVLTNLG